MRCEHPWRTAAIAIAALALLQIAAELAAYYFEGTS